MLLANVLRWLNRLAVLSVLAVWIWKYGQRMLHAADWGAAGDWFPFIDFKMHYYFASNLLSGQDPYLFENFPPHVLVAGKAAGIFPATGVLYTPFLLLSYSSAASVFYAISLAAMVFSLWYMAKRLPAPIDFNIWRPGLPTWGMLALIYILLHSQPVILSYVVGQSSLIICALLIVVFFNNSSAASGISLGIATVLKVTMTPFFGLALLSKGQYRAVAIAAAVVVACSLMPILLGYSVFDLHVKQFDAISALARSEGWDTYHVNWGNLINFDFFANDAANTAGKVIAVAIVAVTYLNERKREVVTLNWLLFLSCVQLIVVYHRIYDLVFTEILLLFLALKLFGDRRWIQGGFAALFILVLMLSDAQWAQLSSSLAEAFSGSLGARITLLFVKERIPHFGVVHTLLTVYAGFLYFFGKEYALSARGYLPA